LLFIQGTTEKITAQASLAADLDFQTDVVPYTASGVGTPTPKEVAGVTATSATDIVDPIGASTQGNVRHISCRNKHASAAPVITFRKSATATVELFKVTLQPGWTVIRDAKGVWFVYDANGGVVMGATAASQTAAGLVEMADTTEMEAATALDRAVAPGVQHRHPATAKAWGIATVSGGVPTLAASYGVTSVTDSAVGQIVFTWSTAFSSANYSVQCNTEYTTTTYAATADRKVAVRNATRATGSISLDCIDSTATTNLKADPAAWFIMANGDQ
jgi:hypothetical protein